MKVDVLFLLTKSIPVFVKAHYCKYPLNLAWLWAICNALPYIYIYICMYIYIYIYIYIWFT